MIHGPVFHVNIIAGGHVDEVHKDLRVSSAGEGGVDGYLVDDTNEVQWVMDPKSFLNGTRNN